jgi:hypothetical protein
MTTPTPALAPGGSGFVRILILACTLTKRHDPGKLAAIERYDGPTFRVLRNARTAGKLEHITVCVLSARYGLLKADEPIEDYDQRLDHDRATVLAPQVATWLDELAFQAVLAERVGRRVDVYLALPGLYRTLIPQSWIERMEPWAAIQWGHGGIGERLAQLKAWLITES